MKILPFLFLAFLAPLGAFASPECVSALNPSIQQMRRADEGRPPVRFAYRPGRQATKNFSGRISNFMTSDGDIFLFRTITAPRYIKNFGRENPFGDQDVGFSYTLDPAMPLSWSYYGDDEKDLILVALQNVLTDALTHPSGDAAGVVNYLNPVRPTTLLSSIAFYDEIKIPKRVENVVAVLRKKEFRALLGGSETNVFKIQQIVSRVAHHPGCRVP